jgi:hypothetical protein
MQLLQRDDADETVAVVLADSGLIHLSTDLGADRDPDR